MYYKDKLYEDVYCQVRKAINEERGVNFDIKKKSIEIVQEIEKQMSMTTSISFPEVMIKDNFSAHKGLDDNDYLL